MKEKLTANYLYFGTVEPDPNWRIKDHRHDHFEIIGVSSGRAAVRYNRRLYQVSGPAILVYQPGAYHQEVADKQHPWKTMYLGVRITGWPGGSFKRQGLLTVNPVSSIREGLSILSKIQQEITGRQWCQKPVITGRVYELIRLLLVRHEPAKEKTEVSPAQKIRQQQIISRLKSYIETHASDKVSLTQLTEVVYLSPYYLSHIFKAETGYSPIHYLIKVKVDLARKLLADPNLTVSQVAARIGYESIHYFSRIFKTVEGISPKAYRNRLFTRAITDK